MAGTCAHPVIVTGRCRSHDQCLRSGPLARDSLLLLKAAGSRVRTIKTFGAPGPVARITVIRWRFLTCLAATLVVAPPPGRDFRHWFDMGGAAWERCQANSNRRETLD